MKLKFGIFKITVMSKIEPLKRYRSKQQIIHLKYYLQEVEQ